MQTYSLFINGVFDGVLKEILKTQRVAPEQILFLQPYSGNPIKRLESDPPTVENPIKLYLSTSAELSKVSYMADIVGWEDKGKLSADRCEIVGKILKCFQPGEGGLYDHSRSGEPSVNLLSIRRLARLHHPFSVAELIKISDREPLSEHRSTSGGWSYVRKSAYLPPA